MSGLQVGMSLAKDPRMSNESNQLRYGRVALSLVSFATIMTIIAVLSAVASR
jgi:hypothetical protein